MKPIPLLLPLLLPLLSFGADAHAVLPASGPAPVGPYSPGVVVGEYLYVSGQGAHRPDGSMPDTFAEQVRQTLENVKAVLEAGGLTMEHIVYTQVYLDDVQKFDQMNGVYAQYFLKGPPARATLGVAKLPGTPVEINAVAVRDLATKKPVLVAGYDPRGRPFQEVLGVNAVHLVELLHVVQVNLRVDNVFHCQTTGFQNGLHVFERLPYLLRERIRHRAVGPVRALARDV